MRLGLSTVVGIGLPESCDEALLVLNGRGIDRLRQPKVVLYILFEAQSIKYLAGLVRRCNPHQSEYGSQPDTRIRILQYL